LDRENFGIPGMNAKAIPAITSPTAYGILKRLVSMITNVEMSRRNPNGTKFISVIIYFRGEHNLLSISMAFHNLGEYINVLIFFFVYAFGFLQIPLHHNFHLQGTSRRSNPDISNYANYITNAPSPLDKLELLF
jgi:hypothetical protein